MFVLGISAFFHDSAACLLKDGMIVAAAEEERFTRIKQDSSFPKNAILFCLEEADISVCEIQLIVFYEKPFVKFDRILNSIKSSVPFGFSLFKKAITSWTKTKLWIPSIIAKELSYEGEIIFSEHHEAHAAGTFFTSPFTESVIITIDGVGEKACTSIAIGKENKVKMLQEQHYPHSFGLFYSAFTQFCGFKVNSGEYKLMGLAPYGKPIYKKFILDNIITISSKGEIQLKLDYFSFEKGESTINSKFCSLFKHSIRKEEDKISQFYCDIAASVQEITDEFLLIISKYAKELTGLNQLCLAGGVALNCKANGRLLQEKIFKDIWVQPASGDDGCAIGAAYIGWYHYLGKDRTYLKNSLIEQIYFGTSYTSKEILNILKQYNLGYTHLEDSLLCDKVSQLLLDKKIVGWFQGKMEFGPRALGNRSILASPVYEDMKEYINKKIKLREGFRPFAPVILDTYASEWFSINQDSKYMLFTFNSAKKEEIPSCIHEDYTARVQTIAQKDNVLLYQLISCFNKKSKVPILINTSFNVRGEPIVESPLDALKCFFQTDMDVVVLGNYLIEKKDNRDINSELTSKLEYELD